MDATEQQGAALSPEQAHEILGKNTICRASFYAALKRGEVPHVKLGRRILIPRARFLRWLEGGEATPRPAA